MPSETKTQQQVAADALLRMLQAPRRERAELLAEAALFIEGFAASGESGFARQRKAQEWLARYRKLVTYTLDISVEVLPP